MADDGAPLAPGPAVQRTFGSQAVQMVRTVTAVNQTLSQMADQKASILMGATFVVFTITVNQSSKGHFPLSLLVLALFSFMAVICAVMVVMPSSKPPPRQPGTENLLFFGVFSQMSETEFADSVLDHIHNDEAMFRTMLRDIHQNGLVLQNKKYRYLGLAYRTFLLGMCLTLLTFLFENRAAIWEMV
jgi:hypothetical protein